MLRKMAKYETKRLALDKAIQKEGAFTIVVLLRLSPAMPLAPANVLLALTSVGAIPYATGTLVGLLPFSAVYSYMGSVGQQAAAAQHTNDGAADHAQTAIQLVGLVATLLLTWKISKVAQKALNSAQEEAGEVAPKAGRRTSRKPAQPARRSPGPISSDAPSPPQLLPAAQSTGRRRTVATARPSTGGKGSDPAVAAEMDAAWKAQLKANGIDPKTGTTRRPPPRRASSPPSSASHSSSSSSRRTRA